MGNAVPIVLTIQPFVRYSDLSTNRAGGLGPPLSAASTPTQVTGALSAAERNQTTAGLSLTLHHSMRLVLEYTRNDEDFNTPTNKRAEVDNDLFVASLRLQW